MSEVVMLNVKVNGIDVQVPYGTTVLEAARMAGVKVPTLCYMKDINEIGACRICLCEVKGARGLVAACVYPIEREGTEIITNSERVIKARKQTLELMLSDHKKDCLSCDRNKNCELQTLSKEYDCDAYAFQGMANVSKKDETTSYLVRDNNKCILCRRCVAVCNKLQTVAVIGANNRGFKTHVGCAFDSSLNDSPCVACGQCINVCPTGALHEKEEISEVKKAINDPEKIVIVAAAPAVRAALGEEFGNPIGTNVEGKMITAMRRLGFDKIFDVNFGADMTIMEEANEFLDRVKNGGTLPLITSCSPGWVRYMEFYYSDLIPHFSTCKSPQQMTGAMIKTYWAEKNGIDPKNIYFVTVMPCVAKKAEKLRDDESENGCPDVDASITTRELAKMIREAGLMFNELPDGELDNPLGEFTGAGVIFGATGGVMEAALRTAVDTLEPGKIIDRPDFKEVRGMEGIKFATYEVAGMKIKVAVANGLSNAKVICDQIREGKADYQFVEIMCCPGGCINGGGQPILDAYTRRNVDYKSLRAKALYDEDANKTVRMSHQNKGVQELYATYFDHPGSEKAHHILHTKYVARKKYN